MTSRSIINHPGVAQRVVLQAHAVHHDVHVRQATDADRPERPPNPPYDLPTRGPHFVGRRQQVAAVQEEAATGDGVLRLVVITGLAEAGAWLRIRVVTPRPALREHV